MAINRTVGVALVGALLTLAALPGIAQYPSKPITMVVPVAPGGINDIFTRLMADKLKDRLGQAIVVENRPGAGGLIGTEYVARAPADGYTLASIYGQSFMPELIKNLRFDLLKDLTPVMLVMDQGPMFVVNASLPVKSVEEFIQYAKNVPGKLNYGTGFLNTTLQVELAANRFGIKLTGVNYKGDAPLSQALISNEIQVAFIAPLHAKTMAMDGKVKVLATIGPSRSINLPEAATLVESGYPGLAISTGQAFWAPAGTPRDVIDRLNRELLAITKMPDIIDKANNAMGLNIVASSPEEMRRRLLADQSFYREAARLIKFEPQ